MGDKSAGINFGGPLVPEKRRRAKRQRTAEDTPPEFFFFLLIHLHYFFFHGHHGLQYGTEGLQGLLPPVTGKHW